MPKYMNKTQPTSLSVEDFIRNNAKPQFVEDCLALTQWLSKITGSKPVLWTNSIGFGKYHYTTKGYEADFFVTGFAPRSSSIALYITGKVENYDALLKQLGTIRLSGNCIHIKSLADINLEIFEQMVKSGIEYMKAHYQVEQ